MCETPQDLTHLCFKVSEDLKLPAGTKGSVKDARKGLLAASVLRNSVGPLT